METRTKRPMYVAKMISGHAGLLEIEKRLTQAAEMSQDHPKMKARLYLHSAFARAQLSRLQARLNSLQIKLTCVPGSYDFCGSLQTELLIISALVHAAHKLFSDLAEMTRSYGDLNTTWVCELGHRELSDIGEDVERLAQ